jgi:transposase
VYRNKQGRVLHKGKRLDSSIINEIKTDFYDNGLTIPQITKKHRVSYHTVKKWIEKEEKTNNMNVTNGEILNRSTNYSEFNNTFIHQFLITLITKHPCIYLREIKKILEDVFGIKRSITSISKMIHSLGFTRKRAVIVERKKCTTRVQRARLLCKLILQILPTSKLVFIDETHVSRKDLSRRYGYSQHGDRVQSISHHLSTESWSTIGAINLQGLVYYEIYDCSQNALTHKEFNFFLCNLAKKLTQEDVVVLDNSRTHRFSDYSRILQQHNIPFIRLSPYSCDLNPIELLWNTIKSKLKLSWNSSRPMDILIEEALLSSTKEEFKSYFDHCKKIWNSEVD